jgi:DNA-directed RNA polymerase specialized sigma24 family protein
VTHSTSDERRPDAVRVFDEHRGLLNSVAYRILGSVTDAEDTVQEAWLRWSGVNPSDVGPWLPEPILTGRDVAEDVALAESVSLAMLVVLETLSPLERAVFVLREAFGMPYAEIADVLGRKDDAVRQLGRRARDHVQQRRSRFDADQSEQRRVTERFLQATSTGNLDALMAVLSPGVTLVADGGGRVLAPRRPVLGAEKVARFLLAVATEERMARFLRSVGSEPIIADLRVSMAPVTGGPGILVVSGDKPISTLVLDVSDGVVRTRTIYLVANPQKLDGVRGIVTP